MTKGVFIMKISNFLNCAFSEAQHGIQCIPCVHKSEWTYELAVAYCPSTPQWFEEWKRLTEFVERPILAWEG